MAFRPKEVLRSAREAETKGDFPSAATAFSQVGSFLLRRGQLEQAASLFEKAVALYPQGSRPYVYLAVCEMELEKSEAAEGRIRSLARLGVEKGRAIAYGELVQEKLEKYPRLLEAFYETLLSLDRTSATPFLAFAKCLVRLGKNTRARRVLLEAFQTRTQETEVLEALGEVLEKSEDADALSYLGRYRSGKASREEFLALVSESDEATGVSVHAVMASASGLAKEMQSDRTLGDLIRDLERELGAEEVSSEAGTGALIQEFRRRAEPILAGSPKARTDIAMAFYEMGLIEEACAELARVPEGEPSYWEAQCLLGEIYTSEGSFLAAVEALQKCLRTDSALPSVRTEALYKLVVVYIRLEDRENALSLLNQLEKESPGYRDSKNLRSQIDSKSRREEGISRRWLSERKKAS